MAIQTRMTADEFLGLPETNLPTELIDGEVMMSPAPVPNHQEWVLLLALLIRSLVPNGKVYVAPIDVYFDSINVVQPAVLWASENGQCRILDQNLQGPPDLIVVDEGFTSPLLDKVVDLKAVFR